MATKDALQLEFYRYKDVLIFETDIEKIEKMDIRDDDIWVASYPRSGTTLTQEMTYLIRTLDFETAKTVQLDDRFPIILKNESYPFYRGLEYVEKMASPRLIKTHLHYFMLPEQLKTGKGKVIYTSRNPKDVVTSYFGLFEWLMTDPKEKIEFETFFDSFVNGTGFYCPWPRHVLEYWEHQKDDNILFLKYEDVVKDLPSTIRRIADFLDRKLTDDDVTRISKHCHVDSMRNNHMVDMSYYRDYRDVNDDAKGRFINKGKPGVWKERLTPEMSQKINDMLKELDGTGLTFEHCED